MADFTKKEAVDWIRRLHPTQNRRRANKAVRELYHSVGAEPPKIVWVDPETRARLGLEWARSQYGDVQLILQAWQARIFAKEPWDWELNRDLRAALGTKFQNRNLVHAAALERAQEAFREKVLKVSAKVGGTATGRERYNARRRLDSALWRMDWPLRTVSGTSEPFDMNASIRPLWEHSGGFTLLPGLAIMEDLPITKPRLDAQRMLHSDRGPVVQYPNGWELYAWHGRVVTKQIVMAPETLTVEQIRGERNAEVRRIMMERYGIDRFMQESNATLVNEDTDQLGLPRRLWKTSFVRGRENLVVVEVTNSTPEPDGTRKRYFLRVPPQMRTAEQAQAWTYNLSIEEWRAVAQFQS